MAQENLRWPLKSQVLVVRPDRHHHNAREPASGRISATLAVPAGKKPDVTFEARAELGARRHSLGLWSGRGTRAGSRTSGTRLRPLFRRAGLRTRAGLGRQSAPPAAGKRGPSEARAVGPPRARPRSPVPAASPPCPASTTSFWRSPSGGCCAHCAGSPCASLCRCLRVATASATPACRSFSGATRGGGPRPAVQGVRAVHGDGLGPETRRAFVCEAAR